MRRFNNELSMNNLSPDGEGRTACGWMKRVSLVGLVVVSLLIFLSFCGAVGAATVYVNPGESIQTAIDGAATGDTIIVKDGIYVENLNVYKALTIQSENGYAGCVVEAAATDDAIFEVTADGVTISGLTVKGAEHNSGIDLNGAKNCVVEENYVVDNFYGAYLRTARSSDNVVRDNEAVDNFYGIYLYYSGNNSILDNTISSNTKGIRLVSADRNDMSGNHVYSNEDGFELSSSKQNEVYENTVYANRDGIKLISSSSDNVLRDNNLSSNTYCGIHLIGVNNNLVYHNSLNENAIQGYDSMGSDNSWDNGYPSGGNYWSDYTGIDADGDGFGDTPYNDIKGDSGAEDRYPLMGDPRSIPTPTPTPTPPAANPCDTYDTNGIPGIQKDEAINAVNDYFSNKIDKEIVVAVVVCYFG